MKSNKNLILGIIIAVLILGLGAYSYNSYSDNQFIRACAALNNKDLTVENLNTLNGKVYAWNIDNYPPGGVGPTSLTEEHLTQYKESFKMPLENNVNHIQVQDDNSFSITQGALDNTWVCNIKLNSEQKLTTKSYYLAD